MKKYFAFTTPIWILLFIFTAYAQNTSISGTITDQTGAAISGAHIVLKGVIDRDAYTDNNGRYNFSSLRSGEYQMVIEKTGFAPVQRKFTFDGTGVALNLTLSPAGVTEVVNIVDNDVAAEGLMKLPGATLHNTPRAVTIIDSEQIKQRNLRSVPEFLNYIPGMSANSYRSGGYHFYARGYRMGPEDTRVDGFIGTNVGGGFGAPLYGVEQAVVLRGPAGLLYGSTGSPGGMINLITKKPQEVRFTTIDIRNSNYSGQGIGFTDRPSFSVDLDSTGAVTPNGRILYRTLFTIENSKYFTNQVLDRNRFANASMTYKLDAEGKYTLTPLAQYARYSRPAGGGIVISPTSSLSANDGSIFLNVNDLSSHDINVYSGGRIDETSQFGFTFAALPTSNVKANLAYRFFRFDTFIDQFAPPSSSAASIKLLQTRNEVNRVKSKSDTLRRYNNIDANISYEYRGGGWKNITQVGGYTRVTSTLTTSIKGGVPSAHSPINIYTGATTGPLNNTYPTLIYGAFAETTNWNGYVQNRTSLFNDKAIVLLGFNYGQIHTGQTQTEKLKVQKSDVNPNVGLVVNVSRQLALYGSYATSFNPVDPGALNSRGEAGTFQPNTGKNYEFGAKYDLLNRRISTNISYFKNEISNAVVQSGPNDLINGQRYYFEAGTRKSSGVELSGDLKVKSNWYFTGAVSYIDSIYTGEGPETSRSTLAIPNSRSEKTPRWQWNATARYERSEGRLAGLNLSSALLWQGKRLGSNGAATPAAPDPLVLPAYARLDANIGYRLNEHWDYALSFNNLTDNKIFVNATEGSAIEIAPPRSMTLRIGYRF